MQADIGNHRSGSGGNGVDLSLSMLLTNLPGMVYRCLNDDMWTMQFVSAGVQELTGYASGQLTGPGRCIHYTDLIHPDDRDRVRQEVQVAIEEHRPFQMTYRIVTAQREVKWVWEKGSVVRGEVGKPATLEGFVTEITNSKQAHEAIRESQQRFDIVAKATTDAIWDWDLKTNHLWWNEGLERLFGFSRQEIEKTSESWFNRIHPDDVVRVLHSIRAVIYGYGENWIDEYRFQRKDGSYAYVLDRGYVIRDHEQSAVRMIGAKVDLTERKEAEEMQREADARIRNQAAMLDKAKDAIVVRGLDNRIHFWNKGAERLYGWSPEEAVGCLIDELLYEDPSEIAKATRIALEKGEWTGVISERHKNGNILIVENHWTLVCDEQGEPQSIFAIKTDITERNAAEQKIRQLAFYDSLTELPNRALLIERLHQSLEKSCQGDQNGALLLIDLDHFKTLNETFGHDKGDMFLQQVALRLATCACRNHTVARFGGDEFVVLAEDLSFNPAEAAAQAKKIGAEIIDCFEQPFQLAGYEYHATPSIGVTLFKDGPATVEDVLKRMDLAMYQAKASGRNTMRFFDAEMQAVVNARVALEADLRKGLQHHEFLLYFQPQFDEGGRIIGSEALLRWQHPVRGMVPPIEFIPLAEETGLILPLGQWVLNTACAQLAAWAAHPQTACLSIAVNVSAYQFRQPNFSDQVLAALDHAGADPRKLKLELTESMLLDNMEDTILKMTAMKAKGIGFALDDFGTGYSSLSYLKQLPLDQIKIDQSFVRDILTDPNDAAIARTVVALGHSLGLIVVAEGVESAAQRDFLAGYGCNGYQGYFFSRPLPCEQFEAFAQTTEKDDE